MGARGAGWCARFIALMALALCASACAQQKSNWVDVGLGTGAYHPEHAERYAMRYLPYAQMANLTYFDPPSPLPGAPAKPKRRSYGMPELCPSGPLADPDSTMLGDLHHNRWKCIDGGTDLPADQCPVGRICSGGLGYQIWLHKTVKGSCDEAVIAFRGTDGLIDPGDWIANLRWFTRTAYYDQYDQMKDQIDGIVRRMRAACPSGAIVATGHSLGGGLAQFVAFANSSISYVYAFDPSPVTGFFDIKEEIRAKTVWSHGVERVYKAGELLSLPRYLASGVSPTTTCLPPIQIVRFSSEPAFNLIDRHKIADLAVNMAKDVGDYKGKPVPRLRPLHCQLLSKPDPN